MAIDKLNDFVLLGFHEPLLTNDLLLHHVLKTDLGKKFFDYDYLIANH